MKSFLLIGQSNMAGRGFVHEVPPIYNERIEMLCNGRWQMMTESMNYDRPVAGVSLASSFAESWCRMNPKEKIGLIPCAEGESSIDEWAAEGILFRHGVSEAKFAMENSQLAGILWHQGESDSDSGKHKTYYEKLCMIVNRLRQELDAPGVPFLIGGLGDYLGKTAFISMPFHRESLVYDTLRLIVKKNISMSRWLMKKNYLLCVIIGTIRQQKKNISHLKNFH